MTVRCRWITSANSRSEEHTSELQSQSNLVCRLLLEKKKKTPARSPRTRHSYIFTRHHFFHDSFYCVSLISALSYLSTTSRISRLYCCLPVLCRRSS